MHNNLNRSPKLSHRKKAIKTGHRDVTAPIPDEHTEDSPSTAVDQTEKSIADSTLIGVLTKHNKRDKLKFYYTGTPKWSYTSTIKRLKSAFSMA
jgi:hypothetical protein